MPELQEYVTVQTHDAQLGRIEALMEANLAHQELIASELRSEIREIKGEIKALDAKIDAKIDGVMDAIAITNSRIDDLQNKKGSTIALWAIAAAIIIGVIQLIR